MTTAARPGPASSADAMDTDTERIVGSLREHGLHDTVIGEMNSLVMALPAASDVVPRVARENAVALLKAFIAAFSESDQSIPEPTAALARAAEKALAPDDRLDLAARLIDSARKNPVAQRDAARRQAQESIFEKLDLLSSSDVGKLLSPSGTPSRGTAQKLRATAKIIGLPSGPRPDYYYPAFQFDTQRRRVRPLVEYANQRILPIEDPFGAANWWLLERSIFAGRSLLECLEDETLTRTGIDNVLSLSNRGM